MWPPPTRVRHDDFPPPIIGAGVYWILAVWSILMGLFLCLAPNDWYGATWRAFAGGRGAIGVGVGDLIGAVLILLGAALLITLRGDCPPRCRRLSALFFLNGLVYWTAGIVLFVAGLVAHTGVMPAPFMVTVAINYFIRSAELWVGYRTNGHRHRQ